MTQTVLHRLLRVVASLALLCALMTPALAQVPGEAFVEAWTTRDGLPHSTVNGIGQTADGFLWLATWEGIARYDGHEFRLYRRGDIPGLNDDSVRALHVGPHGDLWAGSARGGLVRWHRGAWDARPPVDGLVTDLLEEPNGRLWVATARSGVVRIDVDGRRRAFRVAAGLPSDTVNALARDARGAIWIATSAGLARVDGDRARAVVGADLPVGPMFSLFASPRGALLVGTEHGAFVYDGTRFRALHPALAAQTATRLWADDAGAVWVGTNNAGIARIDGDRIAWLDTRQGLPNNRVLALRRDREGSLWVGTNGGLVRLRETPIHTLTHHDGLADDFVRTTLATRDGALWVGGGQGLDRIDPVTQAIAHVGSGTRLADVSVLSLAQDANGDVLVGTFHDGLLRVRDGRVVESTTMADGLPSSEVRAVLAGRDGRLWIGTKQGAVLRDRDGTHALGVRDGLPPDYIQALFEADDGAVWIGTSSGAAIVRGRRVRAIDLSRTDAQYVYAILRAPDGDGAWLGTDRGLVRADRDGRVRAHLDRGSGLPFEKIFAALLDRRGNVWLTGNDGIARVRIDAIERATREPKPRVRSDLFGRADGMASAQANGGSGPAATLDARGRVWVATAIGVARLDPGAMHRRIASLPPITVDRFEVDGHALDPRGALRLPQGEHRIVVRFVAPALVHADNVHYRYRLDGLNNRWIALGPAREVQFTGLDPHAYQLQLEAHLPGEPHRTVRTLAFSIRPYWWQRPWMQAALALATLALLAALFGLRIRQLRRTERRLRGLVDARTAELQVQTHLAERLASTDALTDLANRRALDDALTAMARDAHAAPACLMLVDVDGFKPINDLHGHAAGDLALRAVADVIRTHARAGDLAVRWGGDEFALLRRDCTTVDTLAVAGRLRADVEAIDCTPFAPGLGISASIGVACTGRDGHVSNPRALVARADEALYRAKREGRNRVCAAIVPDAE